MEELTKKKAEAFDLMRQNQLTQQRIQQLINEINTLERNLRAPDIEQRLESVEEEFGK